MSDIDEQMATRFEALMTNERAEHFLMDRAMGDVRLITENNAEEIYREVELIAAERVTKAKDEEINKIQIRHADEIQKVRDAADSSIQHATEENIRVRETLERERRQRVEFESQSALLKDQIGNLEQSQKAREIALVESCKREGIKAERRSRLVTAIFMLGIAILLGLGSNFLPNVSRESGIGDPVLVAIAFIILGAVFSVLNHFTFPSIALERYITNKRDRAVHDHAKALGIDGVLLKYHIDWSKGIIQEIKS